MTTNQGMPAPAIGPRRIATLDVIRGVAVMGILIMNIVAFAMPEVAYINPAAFGGHKGIDLTVWAFNFILVDGKMRGLFSFLFGASTLLVIDRAIAKEESPARVHFARMFWLFLFGEAHMILLWWGDILHHYALIGCIAYLFRKTEPHKLVAMAIILLLTEFLMVSSVTMSVQASEIAMQTPKPSADTIRQFQEFRSGFGVPTAGQLAKDLALHRGPYPALAAHRLDEAISTTLRTLIFVGAETLGYMLLGMACLKSGMLTGEWDRRRYLRWILIGFGIGIPISAALAWYVASQGFAMFPLVLGTLMLPTVFRLLMIVGWACLIVLLSRSGGAIAARLAATGRMAFSNYLGTSILCSTIFYGYGLGLYGHLSRAQLYPIVFAVWALMLLWSKPWLERFRFGPLEWLWRSLARMRLQPMRGPAMTD
ncbi:MAG: DUF418 domain-containing protein [Candidatus Sphingomonas phytovorans]|nr:DUF418 domain-containing protein [Sphingomonas sp.]WEK00322.1 MAG: DUF418 domain-containing protein [Sphingomonas sp.]